MNRIFALAFAFFVSFSTLFSQEKEVLLTIDDEPVYASEFKRVYKKNLDLVQDASQKTVEGYLDLFIDYKLKVKDAYEEGYDQNKDYKKEFAKYQEQLSVSYIYEDNLTDDLIKEAYERGKYNIKASHILIKFSSSDLPSDTLKAYNKIKDLKKRALAGEDFETLAKENSEDPSAVQNSGDLGYFSVFSMVYPFETAAYNTKVGEISDIVRTNFGYHILKVTDKKEKQAKRTISHIMILDKDDDTRTFDPEERIEEVYQLWKQGEKFEDLAKQYSEDKGSAMNGGKLRPFDRTEVRAKIFADSVFNIESVGNVTMPFRSEVGWHIVRLDEIHKKPSFEESRVQLEQKVKSGNRSKIITNAVLKQIKDKYGFSHKNSYLPFFETYVDKSVLMGKWTREEISEQDNKTLFIIGDKQLTFSDFANFIEERQSKTPLIKTVRESLGRFYELFENEQIRQYFRDQLENENEEYASVIQEYRNGLLIFNLMSDKVWDAAKQDSIGLRAHYEKNKIDYKWNNRFEGAILKATSKENAKTIKTMLEEGKTAKEIKSSLNTYDNVQVVVSAGKFEVDSPQLPDNVNWKTGVSNIYEKDNGFLVLQIDKLLPPSTKEFEEVKGKVMSSYQTKIEEDWIFSLRDKYDVKVNKKTLKKLKKELNS